MWTLTPEGELWVSGVDGPRSLTGWIDANGFPQEPGAMPLAPAEDN